MFDWPHNQVCLAEGPRDSFVLLAVRPERLLDTGGDGETVAWHDGAQERACALAKVHADEPRTFRFEDELGRTFTLRPLTAALYASHVRDEASGPELDTDEAVHALYLAPRE